MTINLNFYKPLQEIGLEEFYDIVDKEESVSEQELVNAFRCIDTDHNGVISKKELLNLLTTVRMNFY